MTAPSILLPAFWASSPEHLTNASKLTRSVALRSSGLTDSNCTSFFFERETAKRKKVFSLKSQHKSFTVQKKMFPSSLLPAAAHHDQRLTARVACVHRQIQLSRHRIGFYLNC
jgi:hypothetical protein